MHAGIMFASNRHGYTKAILCLFSFHYHRGRWREMGRDRRLGRPPKMAHTAMPWGRKGRGRARRRLFLLFLFGTEDTGSVCRKKGKRVCVCKSVTNVKCACVQCKGRCCRPNAKRKTKCKMKIK